MSDEQELQTVAFEGEINVRDASAREIEMRVVPWDVVRTGKAGPEMFQKGAFDGVRAEDLVLRLEHLDPPAGRGIALETRDDGQWAIFKVSETARGDEILTLARDKVTRGVSPGYYEVPDGIDIQTRSGRRTRVIKRARLAEVSTTWRPTWEQSAVLAVRSQSEGDGQMAEPEAASAATVPAVPAIVPSVDTSGIQKAFDTFADRMAERLDKLEERSRQQIIIPGHSSEPVKPKAYDWLDVAIRMMTGQKFSERDLQTRSLLDFVAADNPGLVPDGVSSDLIGVIDPVRPFCTSTRRVDAPPSGTTIQIPTLGTRATVDVQVNEKDDVDSTAPIVTMTSFDMVTIAGGADVSIQIIKRSTPSALQLLLDELAEAYAIKFDSLAIEDLLGSAVTPGTGTLDPADLEIGEAWSNSISTYKRAPDTIWLSSEAVELFINAKNDGTNAPLYSNLAGNLTVAAGAAGLIQGLRPVYVPALDGTGTDVLIGPAAGFAWAEVGTFQLDVDVPSKAGHDVALVGMAFFMPRYPAAFTTYAV